MYTLDQLFTFGNWFVKLGKEEDFKKEWKEFADWSIRNKLGSNTPYLLQDITNVRHFISFGPWPDVQTIKKWRQTEEFQLFELRSLFLNSCIDNCVDLLYLHAIVYLVNCRCLLNQLPQFTI